MESITSTSKSANYVIQTGDTFDVLFATAPCTITLPAASSSKKFVIVRTDSTSQAPVVIAASGGASIGAQGLLNLYQAGAYDLVSDGTNWSIV